MTITSTWYGVNILVWTNTTTLKKGKKYSIVAAKYDSQGWWSEEYHKNTFPCITNSKNPNICRRNVPPSQSSIRSKTLTTSFELFGSAVLLQLAKSVMEYQKKKKRIFRFEITI